MAEEIGDDLRSRFDAFQMEHRGFELARRLKDGTWDPVATYRPNDRALKEAITSQRQLEWRSRQRGHPEVYAVRPLVSLSIDFAARQAPPVDIPADAMVTPDQLRLDSDQEQLSLPLEESLIIKPEGTEFAGNGFVATPEQGAVGNVEIPYNYDQLAGSIDIPNLWGNDGER